MVDANGCPDCIVCAVCIVPSAGSSEDNGSRVPCGGLGDKFGFVADTCSGSTEPIGVADFVVKMEKSSTVLSMVPSATSSNGFALVLTVSKSEMEMTRRMPSVSVV